MRVQRAALFGVFALATVVALSACGDAVKRLKSKVVAINMIIDVGDPFGAAPRQAGLLVNLMQIEGPIDEPEATPLTGATVTVEATAGVTGTLAVPETGAGVYTLNAGTNASPAFTYNSNGEYTVTMEVAAGERAGTYITKVNPPPRTNVEAGDIPDFLLGETHPSDTALDVTLTGSYDRGFVLVLDSSGNTVYDSRPTDVQTAIDFALGDFNGTLTIPATAFPEPNSVYGVVIVGLESAPSSQISSNLNILTRFYAGSAFTALVRTDP